PGMDGYGVDPRIPRFQKSYKGSGGRPFILATPHHSMAWAGSQRGASTIDRQDVAQYEEALIQLEQLLQQGIDELQALDEQYQSLLMEYEALKTGQR
ncbi:MAG: hypothetical protein K8R68_11460, partial [Bacteroidales bacterium]|nr:hypothetical protein [Bacteroidales bacterium]